MWNNEYLVSLVTQQRQVILPLVYEALEKNKLHWNPAVQGLTSNIRKMLEELDAELFQDCKRQYDQKQASLRPRQKRALQVAWQAATDLASA